MKYFISWLVFAGSMIVMRIMSHYLGGDIRDIMLAVILYYLIFDSINK